MPHEHPAEPTESSCCSPSSNCCTPTTPLSLSRRSFIAATTAVAGAALSRALATPIAGPFTLLGPDDFPIPADKKFSPEWLASLTARGAPTIYRYKRGATPADTLDELKYIGMPVGGICTGQLYLGGDGKLWLFDIFNQPAGPGWSDSSGGQYAKPPEQSSQIEQGFALRVSQEGAAPAMRRLDRSGFPEISFKGQYPIGTVEYRDKDFPVEVSLEAFSPFIPLDIDDSGIPATILNYTLKNTGSKPLTVDLAGWLQSPVGTFSLKGKAITGFRSNAMSKGKDLSFFDTMPGALPKKEPDPALRPAIVFEDFEKPTYAESMGGWTATGTAFGDGPVEVAKRPGYMGELNAQGLRAVNTHVTSHAEDVVKADTHVGTLTSREFTIERNFISFLLGGGKHPDKECVNLLIDGAKVRTATGRNANRMHLENFDVREFAGRKARLQIVDDVTGGWGQVGVDDIVFCDEAREPAFVWEEQGDYGSIGLAVRGEASACRVAPDFPELKNIPQDVFARYDQPSLEPGEKFTGNYGCIGKQVTLAPGQVETVSFILTWCFPNLDRNSLAFIKDIKTLKRHYATRFKRAWMIAKHVSDNFDRLTSTTRLWRDTWYDSTLPYWFLDRTFATVATAATSTCYRFDNGRFYGWEGTYCCAGTCTHVWQYAQSLARIFPALERNVRETIDFDQEFNPATGLIHYRGEAARDLAIDGQCGTILRAYREHTMCPDDAFLKKVWPNVKKAIELVIARDENEDGILDGPQYNTLDTTWFGQISWITSLYLAVLRAGGAMARDLGDKTFADKCDALAASGFKNMPEKLFTGEYFIHITDPKHPETNSTGTGCHSDQVMGQAYCHQLGLPRILPLDKTQSALRSLYKYNLALDIGPYREQVQKTIKGGRWYAMPGEGGLLVCTWPKGGIEAALGQGGDAWAGIYFNECWTGFEHQVAAHMLYEGLVTEGLAVERMLHDRHHAAKRNPYNEVECSSHYARAMSAFGAYLGICGYAHHGPSGFLAFDPRLTPDNFRAAFTCATGWGTYAQTRAARKQSASLLSRWGTIRVARLQVGLPAGAQVTNFSASLAGKPVAIIDGARTADSFGVRFQRAVELAPGDKLELDIVW